MTTTTEIQSPATKDMEFPNVAPHNWTDGADKVLILRRCNADGTSSAKRRRYLDAEPFEWPASGHVQCDDWVADTECGGGLHGWPWGMGLGDGAEYNIIDDKWIVFAADPADVIGEVAGGLKCKAKKGEVIHFGPFASAWAMINSGRHRLIEAMANVNIPDVSVDASSGYGAQLASSGYDAQLASSGNGAQLASSGYGAKLASSGNGAQLASSGNGAQLASSGYGAQLASSGNDAKLASSGYGAKLDMTGAFSTAVSSGLRSRVRGIDGCSFAVAWMDGKITRYVTGVIGENGIKPSVWYHVIDGKLIEC